MRGRRLGQWLVGGLLALAVAACAALAAGYALARRSLWRPDGGPIRLAGLREPAAVALDRFGVPHVHAHSAADAVLVEGYLHARDRFFQMEVARRAVAGRLAELFGRRALPLDREMRRLGMGRVAARQAAELDSESRSLLASYAAGVNAALAERGASGLAPEFLVVGGDAGSWREEDTVGVGLGLCFSLTGAAGDEARRADQLQRLGRQRATNLWGWSAEQARDWIPPNWSGVAAAPGGGLLSRTMSALGSNNWAIAPGRTRSGAATLANDPHVGVANPATWYEIALDAPGLHAAGASLPGAPGVLIGHDADVAWGFTMVMLDDQDLFRLQLDPSGGKERVGEGYRALDVREETIRVRGGGAEKLVVKVSRHGPVVREDGGDVEALAWTALVGRSVLPAFLRLDRSTSVGEAAAAFADADAPAMNLVAADRAGHIRWQVVGRVPVRGRGAGRLPAPGWDEAWDWRGLAPYAANPTVTDPPQGFLATANHDPFAEGDTSSAPFPGEFAPPWRVRAIRHALASRSDWGVASCEALQMDGANGQAQAILERLRPLLARIGTPAARRLLDWDGRMNLESKGALLWAEFLRELTRRIGGDEARETGLRRTPIGGEEVIRLLDGGIDALWWDDVSTQARETRDKIVAAALEAAARRAGEDTWGSRHAVLFAHPFSGIPLLGALFDRGPFPVAGASTCIDATAYRAQADDFAVIALPSMRFVADLADWDRAEFVLPLGQSGHFLSPHAADQTLYWRVGRAHPMPWSEAAVRRATVTSFDVLPAAPLRAAQRVE
ncbi:MAG TPA: penicillin acylase family protein [Thermoanaerobaculaceae bacterium]|nr:penicillin acylase family protein [Thermoanaerobaculaceae bacterium]